MKKTTLSHVGQSMAEGSFNLALLIKTSPIYNSRKLIYYYI